MSTWKKMPWQKFTFHLAKFWCQEKKVSVILSSVLHFMVQNKMNKNHPHFPLSKSRYILHTRSDRGWSFFSCQRGQEVGGKPNFNVCPLVVGGWCKMGKILSTWLLNAPLKNSSQTDIAKVIWQSLTYWAEFWKNHSFYRQSQGKKSGRMVGGSLQSSWFVSQT